jgi:acyl carrier protein
MEAEDPGMRELQKVILDYVTREYLEEGQVLKQGAETPLISGGIVDSFSMVSLKRFVEKKYAVQIPDAEATPAAFDTVAGIARLVARLRGAAVHA